MESFQSFKWRDLGNVELGRPNLGNSTNVVNYRLLQYSIMSVLKKNFGDEKARQLLREAGKVAGVEFCRNMLNINLRFNEFIAQLTDILLKLRIGNLRVEKSDLSNYEFTFVITEDLDCSGLPIKGNTVCDYDEGFLKGILDSYLNKNFIVEEVDCWSTGGRVCRFEARICNEN